MIPLETLREALHGRYLIDREIGRGGMATVYRAHDVRHDRTVAIKVLHPELAEAVGSERFLREVRITARLVHPHALPLLDSGEAGGLLYYVMPFIEGETLRDRLRRDGELPVEEALRLVREVGEALEYAHGLDVVHRDIKPENILLQGGHALLADFGIARVTKDAESLTLTGVAIGTPHYMSPEQATGVSAVDGRSDQYSLACVAYELLTGEPPYMGPTPMAITARKLTEPVPSLSSRRTTVPSTVAAAITRALSRAPADRFASMHAFIAELQTGGARDGAAPAAASAPASMLSRPARRQRAWLVAALLLVVTLAGAATLWRTLGRPGAATAAVTSAVAVLPFENLSADSSQAFFADGLTDELVTSLSRVDGLRVASRTSTGTLVRNGSSLADIAQRLDVQAVVEGSVRINGDRARVTARVVKVAGERPIWSETYDRPTGDVLRIQEEIATAIVMALRGRMYVETAESRVGSGTADPEAYEQYLQGTAARWRQTEVALETAAARLRQSIVRDPNFARAHAALASTYAVQGWYDYRPPKEVFPLAIEEAEAALRLDPANALALSVLGYATLYYKWDLPAAGAAFQRAIAADSNYVQSHQWYGNYLTVMQQWDQAEAEFRTALRLEPVSPVRHAVQAWVVMYRGDFPRAVELYRRAAAYDSTYLTVFEWGAVALEGAGLLDEAVAAMQRAVQLSTGDAGSLKARLARLHAVTGKRADALRLLAEVMRSRVLPVYDIAAVHLALGDKSEALRWLDRAYEARSHSMVFLRIDPHLKPLRGDPTFEALASKVGL